MLALVLLLASLLAACRSKLVTFSNTQPKRDASGAIMNAHDGTIQRFTAGGRFYYHAMGYPGDCNETGKINGCTPCIYGTANTISVFSSPDLSSGSWQLESAVYPGPAGFPPCTYFRSQAVLNPATGLYVLWANVAGCDRSVHAHGPYAVATAPAPGGPFTFRGFAAPPPASIGNSSGTLGDYALLVDADGAGYGIFTLLTHGAGSRDMYVLGLQPDFLNFSASAAASSGVLPGPKLVEAPSLLRRGQDYYAFLGGCTCMGLYGGGVAVLRAAHPLGPWALQSDAVDPGCAMLRQSTCFEMGPGAVCNPVTQAQQNYVAAVPLADGSVGHVWTGDRWQQSPDGAYDQQPQTWLPLGFDADGSVQQLQWVDEFTLDVAV